MRMASKPPSEWLYLLCPDWAALNANVVAATDIRLMSYKPYLGGQLSSQLLCRLSIFGRETISFLPWMEGNSPPSFDFWKILGVEDDFDRAHIVANIERFCSVFNICGGNPNDSSSSAFSPISGANQGYNGSKENATKMQQRRSKCALKESEKQAFALRKAAEKAARAASREEKRKQKIEIKRQRAEMTKIQREVAFKKVAELVQSARVPTEIIDGYGSTAAAPRLEPAPALPVPAAALRKNRSSIVISTASDLDQIVTYSNILWEKYNAAAKEHNKRVKWIMVAKELGINVKVREKYARMHARAKMRGFDFVNWGHYRIKDYPQYFIEPLTPVGSLPADGNYSPPPEQETRTDSMNEVGEHEADQAIFNLAMEVAEAGGYSSDPAPEYMAAMEATMGSPGDDLNFHQFHFGHHSY